MAGDAGGGASPLDDRLTKGAGAQPGGAVGNPLEGGLTGGAGAQPGTAAGAAATGRLTEDRLRITEIFFSIQGEARFSGWPTVFVRLTGCPLRCAYCDTAYAFTGGEWRGIDSIVNEIAGYSTPYVCVTGGEPLAQRRCLDLLIRLCDRGYRVALETSGAMDIGTVDPRVHRVLDVKTPGSGEVERNRWENLAVLDRKDSVKLVICDRADYEWARRVLDERVDVDCPVFFSPSHDELPPGLLADWILADRLPVRMQVQLHKVLWGDVPGR